MVFDQKGNISTKPWVMWSHGYEATGVMERRLLEEAKRSVEAGRARKRSDIYLPNQALAELIRKGLEQWSITINGICINRVDATEGNRLDLRFRYAKEEDPI